jgi:hypothetical protein
MKLSLLPTTKKIYTNQDIDKMIEAEHAKIKAEAYNSGKHDGMKDPAMPLTQGDKLIHYISFKSGYESLIIKVLQTIQPITQIAEGKMEKDNANAHTIQLTDAKEKIQKQINFLKRELGNYDPSELESRIHKTTILGIGLFIGEVALNTQAFQVTGENLLSSFILSASVSLAVSLGAHFAGRKYKDATTKLERRTVIVVSIVGITIVSSVIASLRTIFLQRIGVDVNPIYFTVFNIVFFLIAAFATWYLYPTKEEIENNRENLQKYKQLKKLEKEKTAKEIQLSEHEKSSSEKLKENLRALVYAEYAIERIKVM